MIANEWVEGKDGSRGKGINEGMLGIQGED
jgi:hypothetical protein